MNLLENDELKKLVEEEVKKQLQKLVGFTSRTITDTPTDNLATVNRKYVNMYGSILGRPQNSVIGQQYFSTTDGYPIFRNQNNAWVSATGSVVG